jgi:pimeloyl-ACP methyl ester carboxylesterase
LSVLFIHGAGGNPAVWHLQTRHFSDSAALELPGHPNGQGLTSVEGYATFVEHEIYRRGIRAPVLVGHSMGGAITIELALRRRDLKALILVGSGARLRVSPELLGKIKENYGEAARLIAAWSVSSQADPVFVDRIADDLLKIRPKVTLGDFLACDRFDRMDRVQEISYRTLIVCGEEDQMTPPKYSKYLQDAIKGSELVLIPGAGHGVMLEKHREFNQALEHFLASL